MLDIYLISQYSLPPVDDPTFIDQFKGVVGYTNSCVDSLGLAGLHLENYYFMNLLVSDCDPTYCGDFGLVAKDFSFAFLEHSCLTNCDFSPMMAATIEECGARFICNWNSTLCDEFVVRNMRIPFE
jgi:hypothetical protein